METNNKRRVMSIAHRLFKNLNEEIIEVVGGANDAWKMCIRYAWSMERFRKALSNGVVVFSYIK
ncbi:hypothetical protein, partial [Klebsiella pneumoniae]|uniref:hypothetical protein n=1 Tax=Klebsiella pneumoniae TaxID=573 RepID=UPI0025A20E7C